MTLPFMQRQTLSALITLLLLQLAAANPFVNDGALHPNGLSDAPNPDVRILPFVLNTKQHPPSSTPPSAPNETAITFENLPWLSPIETVGAHLNASGMTFTGVTTEGDHMFEGTLLGEQTIITAFLNHKQQLVKVHVQLHTPGTRVFEAFNTLSEALVGQLGECSQRSSSSGVWLRNAGSEQQSVLSMAITAHLTVVLAYVSPEWRFELARRQLIARGLS